MGGFDGIYIYYSIEVNTAWLVVKHEIGLYWCTCNEILWLLKDRTEWGVTSYKQFTNLIMSAGLHPS